MSKNVFLTKLLPHREQGPMPAKKCVWSDFLIIVGFGLMLVLLPGCGSDSKPGATAQASAEKKKSGAPVVASAKNSRRVEVVPGLTRQELEAKAAESMAQLKNAPGVVIGGLTQQELEARAAESRKILAAQGGGEVFPGITQRELENMAARGQGRKSSVLETFPGATQAQVDASQFGEK